MVDDKTRVLRELETVGQDKDAIKAQIAGIREDGGTNIDHPALSAELGARKAELARERKAAVVAVGNVGCMLQIARAISGAGIPTVVRHPVQLLAEAYRAAESAG